MQFKQKKLLLYYQPTPTTLHDMGDSTLHTTLTHVVPRGRLKRLEREPSPERGSRIATALRPRFHKARIIGRIGEHRNTLMVFSSLVHLSMPECQRISVNCMLAGWTHTQAPRMSIVCHSCTPMSHLTARVHARGNRGGDKGTDLLPSTRIEKVIGDQHRGGPSSECEENDGEVDGGAHSGWMGDDEQVVGDIPFERAAGVL